MTARWAAATNEVVGATRRWVSPRRPLVALTGAALAVVGSNTPWATFAFGFPGKMTLAGFPGGARLFPLLLVAPALLSLVDLPGRRRAALSGGAGVLVAAAVNLVAIANEGGGLGAVAFGAWLTMAGGALLLAGALSCPDDRPLPERLPGLPTGVEVAAVGTSLGAVLGLVWWGLDIEESSRFVSYVAFVSFFATALHALGLFSWLESLYERHRAAMLIACGTVAVLFPFTQGGESRWIRVFAFVGIFAAASIGLNVVVGLAGLLDLGYVAFFGVGAYVAALTSGAAVSTSDVDLPYGVVILIGALGAAVVGVIIGAPTLRLRGDYLAIVTLAFGEIFYIAVRNMDWLTRGPNGISRIPDLALGGFDLGDRHTVLGVDLPGFANYYFLDLVLLAWVILVFSRLNKSRIGRAWVAIREDEVAAAAMGVNTAHLKLLAFAIGAFLAGAAGTVNAHFGGGVSPDSYTFLESITLLAAVVLGGMGTIPGALLGSTLLLVIPEKLRAFQDPRLLLFGLALVLMMRFRPEGIAASRRRQRELHEAGGQADALSAPPGSAAA